MNTEDSGFTCGCDGSEVEDQGVDQPNKGLAWNAARATVKSGLIKHHMVRIEPANPAALDVATLNGLKV